MKKKLLSVLAFLGLMHGASAAEPTDVTANYLQNYMAPFATTGETLIGDNTRWQLLAAPWVIENGLGTKGVDYTAWHVDFQKMPYYPTQDNTRMGAMALTPGWDGFAGTMSNMKVYQVVTLPAGNYEAIARRAQDWTGAATAHFVIAAGEGIPDIENIGTAIGSALFNTAAAPEWTISIPFKLTAETQVSIGAVASYNNAKQSVTLSEFKLLQFQGINLNPLKTVIAKYKAYTTTQYPVLGTYAEADWNTLQAAIASAEAFVAAETGTEAEMDAHIAALNTAAETLVARAVLPRLLATAQAMNNTQYPIGIIMGTYPQEKWDALQAAIATVSAFVANSTVSEQDIATNQALLQAAIDDLNGSMILPFKLSNDSETHWYQVRDQRATQNYWHMGEFAKSETEIFPLALIISQVGDNTLDEQLFKFVKAPAPSKGYYIYNKLVEDVALTGSTYLNVTIFAPDSAATTWQFGKTISPTHFTVYKEGAINRQLNSYANYTPPYIGFYYPGAGVNDYGNNWEFIELIGEGQTDFTALKTLVATAVAMTEAQYPTGTAENQFSPEKWNVFVSIRTAAVDMVARETSGTPPTQSEVDAMLDALQTAIDELKASQNPPVLVSDNVTSHWYMVRDYRSPNASWWKIDSIGESANRLAMIKSATAPQTNDSLLFKFVKAADPLTGYLIYSKLDETNALSADIGGNFIGFGAEMIPTSFVYEASNKANYFLLKVEEGGNQLNSYAGYNPPYIAFYAGGTADPGNNWTFVPAQLTGVEKSPVTDLGIYVQDRRILSNNSTDKLNVFNISGQRVNANTQLNPGIYIVKVEGKAGAAKVMVR
ncbi:MAG: hypothetical protein BGP01_02865 [Paludibacter sp. 47-17]|nr:MAG: hypothetical protein BGP01_02865 [Paludibacter sp. 47-17]